MRTSPSAYETDVIIIGGGATGASVARDCARRGLRCVLLERRDYATGATGRNHGLLHSGARYAVTDGESARECIEENTILRRTARHCVEETGGLFITLPEDDPCYQHQLLQACAAAGIPAEAIDPAEALRFEPAVNPDLVGAVRVPDGVIDPFRLTLATILDATRHGATCLTYREVTDILRAGDAVVGVRTQNRLNGETSEIRASVVVNAAGIWGQHIAEMAGVSVRMFPTRGALLILGHRINNRVINRCRKPADADILVPGDTVCLIGTTSVPIPFDELDHMRVTTAEADLLIREGGRLAPELITARKLRVYAGARPLVADESDPTGRSISRRIVLLDHEARDGLKGFVTIAGGKLITSRRMGEMTTNLLCEKLGCAAVCDTATASLPGSGEAGGKILAKLSRLPVTVRNALFSRHGDQAAVFAENDANENSLVCECESVTVGEINHAVDHLGVHTITDLRRRTRIGMGTCQGELCACRAAGLLVRNRVMPPLSAPAQLADFLEERWKGIQPLAWGDALRESEFTLWLYQGVCGLDAAPEPDGRRMDSVCGMTSEADHAV
ncbi:anaerobic glycerol-3-phosphate dehydrogenase subunit A [Desulfosarcina sp. OttesenSCG-928-B08]|nr:anaerobic glycerol-3-phosphate dehydrogenase subunit A [Desulfosarcina sp. OttesenSCG-928-B08]